VTIGFGCDGSHQPWLGPGNGAGPIDASTASICALNCAWWNARRALTFSSRPDWA